MSEVEHDARSAVIIEDDPEIAELLEAVLSQAGFRTHVATDGVRGLELIQEHNPLLTTLDVNLPGIDGFEVARRIRGFSSTYVIMLSARQDEIDTLTGLNAGADDYLAKPFRPRELRARVEAMIRRHELEQAAVTPGTAAPASDGDWLSHNGLRVHPSMRLAELDGSPVNLTRTEFELLLAILQHSRRVVSKDELAGLARSDLNSYAIEADRRSMESHIANLRRKLSDSATTPRFIETVRGVGYRLAKGPRPGLSGQGGSSPQPSPPARWSKRCSGLERVTAGSASCCRAGQVARLWPTDPQHSTLGEDHIEDQVFLEHCGEADLSGSVHRRHLAGAHAQPCG